MVDADTPDPDDLKALVARYVQVASGRNARAYVDLFADDAVIVDPVGTPPHVGRDAILAFRQSALDACADLRFEANDVRAAGDHVAFNFTVTAAVGDDKMIIQGIEIFQVADGRIKAMTAIWGEADAAFA